MTTEPIAVVGGAEAPHASRDLQETVPLGDLRRELVGGGSKGSAVPDLVARPDHAGDAKSARRGVAAAERERRRYERQEVRRFTKRSRRRRLVWSVVGGALALLVVVVVGGAYSPLMALREVRVEGAARIPAEQIVAAFEGELGTPLPLVTRDDVHRALADFSLIETYSTETIPPGTLVVRIVERTPVGVIETDRGLELVDGAGVVIDRLDARPDGQPLIETPGGIASDGFRAVAATVRSLPAEIRALLVGASAETADDVRLELAGGVPVVWGGAGDSATKAAVLARLMAVAPPDTVSGYDVSSPESAVTY
ncbi:FtsQ-type POTRA domain-containing protein [Agromyces italicus]|uniref:FtsQ-type POTRA domain-containing protein n=1 Tax=Agromyces italicus TaxID=279572 RepID=UPI0003B7B67B|nr:FtsQ-type POTRA domain-containing protein [Agromyces italicus]